MRNKNLIYLAILIIVGVAFFFILKTEDSPSQTSYEFNGNLTGIEDGKLLVDGTFKLEDGGISASKNVKVAINKQTKIIREALHIPNTTEGFIAEELPKDVSEVDLAKILEDSKQSSVGMFIKSNKNIFDKESFTATEIVYRVPVFTR